MSHTLNPYITVFRNIFRVQQTPLHGIARKPIVLQHHASHIGGERAGKPRQGGSRLCFVVS